eukprot:2967341-Rhodomonas_salina.1
MKRREKRERQLKSVKEEKEVEEERAGEARAEYCPRKGLQVVVRCSLARGLARRKEKEEEEEKKR